MGDRAAAKLNNKFSRQNAALGAETRDAAYERVLCERVAAVDAAVGAPMDVAKRLRADAAGDSVAIAAEFKRASPSSRRRGPPSTRA